MNFSCLFGNYLSHIVGKENACMLKRRCMLVCIILMNLLTCNIAQDIYIHGNDFLLKLS